MTWKGFWRFVFAYCAASLAVAVTAYAAAEAFASYGLTFKTALYGLWLSTVGWLGISYTIQKLGATLGIRPTPILAAGGWRSVPILGGPGGLFAEAVRSVLPASNGHTSPTLEVADEWAFLVSSHVFPEAEVKDVLTIGWKRQRSGKPALPRSHWLDRGPFWGDRDKYDCFCLALEGAGILVNRKPRHSGRLTHPPLSACSELRHRLRRVRVN